MRADRRSLHRRVRAVVARGGWLLCAIVLLLGVLRSGASYFYCPMMKAAFAASCCAGTERHDAHESDAPEIARPDCCEARRMGSLPAVATAPAPELSHVPLAAELPAFDLPRASLETTRAVRFVHPARAGPTSARERRAELMIWTC